MAAVDVPGVSLRMERSQARRLAWAVAISAAAHLLVFGGYHTNKQFHWWDNYRWPSWLKPLKVLVEKLASKTSPQPLQPLRQQEPPLLFVEVTPTQETPEPPKDAKYYSSRNSQAANTEADKDTDTPRITGEEKRMARTEDVPKNEFKPLQPVPPAPPAAQAEPEMKPRPTKAPGDLTMARPDPSPNTDPGDAPRPRPRTIREALARQPDSVLSGKKMSQEGGVRRKLEFSSLDAKATTFGAYDYAFIQAVQQRWYSLLEERSYASDANGRVVVNFVLHYDGRVSDMDVPQNTAGEVLALICQKAILDPAPYASWPSDMRHEIGEKRKIQFTFYYY